jgi:hypothetical protein
MKCHYVDWTEISQGKGLKFFGDRIQGVQLSMPL